jgi:hypothetical protein
MKKEYLIARIDPFGKIDTIVISKPDDEPMAYNNDSIKYFYLPKFE